MKLYPNVTVVISIWAVVVSAIFYFSFSFLPHSELFPHDFLSNLANWDGGHYLGIAKNGYTQNQFVFFPFYPMLINLISRITGDFLSAGLIISFISIFLAANLLYYLVKIDFGKQYADLALLALLFFPLSFHFLTLYAESLFLFLTLATFVFTRKKRYILATVCAAFASATRLAGLATVLSLVLSVYLTEGFNRKNWWVVFSPLGLLIYCFYLYTQTGDLFYFVTGQTAFWQGGLVWPGSSVVFSIRHLTLEAVSANFRNLLDVVFALFGIFGVWQVWRKLSLDYTIFSVVSLMLPLFSPTIVALPRYVLTIFPIFIVLCFYKNQYLRLFYQMISLMLLSVYIILFINGYWVS